jgi:hypothetical protein
MMCVNTLTLINGSWVELFICELVGLNDPLTTMMKGLNESLAPMQTMEINHLDFCTVDNNTVLLCLFNNTKEFWFCSVNYSVSLAKFNHDYASL